MRLPYDRFLTYLVSRKIDPNPALRRYGLPDVDRLWILDIRKHIRDTAPPSVVIHIDSDSNRVLAHDGFLDWAEAVGIRHLWELQPEFGAKPLTEEMNAAFSIFMNRFSRSVMGLLLLAKIEDSDIIETIKERLNLGIDATAIALYRSLFWDVSHVRRDLWPRFTDMLLTKEEKHIITIGYRDQPGLDVIRQVLNLDPDKVTEEIALTHLIETAHDRYKLALQQEDPEHGDAFKWAHVLLKAVATSNSRSKVGGESGQGDAVDLSGLFSVKVTKSHHVSLSELQGQISSVDEHKSRSEG